MSLPSKWAVVAAVLALASAASDAQAARMAQQQGAQLTQGWVIGVHRGNGQPAFRVRIAGVNNQAALAANQNGAVLAAQNAQKFFVGPGTMFEAAQGMNLVPASFAVLRSGQRVIIESQGPQAIRVRIFPRNQYVGRAQRVRPARYPSGSTFGVIGSMPAVQGAKTPPANHHVATHVKSGKR
jgi:hypothetical protein